MVSVDEITQIVKNIKPLQLYVRGCRIIDGTVIGAIAWGLDPEFFGLYARLPDGTSEWLDDFDCAEDAEKVKEKVLEGAVEAERVHARR